MMGLAKNTWGGALVKIFKFQVLPSRSSQLQRTPILFENRVQLPGRERQHIARERQDRVQTIRHIVRRDLIQQTDRIVGVETEGAVAFHRCAEPAQGVEIILADVPAQQDGMQGIHLHEVAGDIHQRHRAPAAQPSLRWDLLRVVEGEFPVTEIRGAEEEFLDRERGVAFDAEGGEELEEEAGGGVEEDGFGAEVEVWVVGSGLGVALGHVEGHVVEVEAAARGGGHHAEESGVEGEVVGLGEEEVGAGEGGVGFEFLDKCRTTGVVSGRGWDKRQ